MELQRSRKIILCLLFACSGFCALVYEVLWTKYLSLVFGTTMIAVSLVAATFMGGLALGSYLVGRYADHESNLLSIYALLELGIALCALLFPPSLGLVERAYAAISQSCPGCGPATHLAHLGFSALLLLPPTVCMGGTFPLMCRFFARKKSGGQIGRLYALNTLGATLGAFLSGYLLIPALGLSLTGYLAAAANLVIAAASWQIARHAGGTVARDVSLSTRDEQPLHAAQHRLVLIAIGCIGFFSLAYEILWTRVLLLFLGNTTYAFALLLSVFLVGIALGGALYARLVHPQLDERVLFIRLSLGMAVSVLATVPFYDQLARLFLLAHQASGERWWHLSMLSSLIVLLVIGLPTVLSGALLPAAVALLNPGKGHTGEGVGLVVLHNTLGAVAGSLAAGFLLIPWLGLLGSFRLLAALNLLLALALWLRFRPTGRLLCRFVPVFVTAGLVVALLPFEWDARLMNSGVYIYAPKYTQMGGIDKILEDERIVATFEGRDTTAAVHESLDGRFRFFTVNGKTDGGNGRDMSTQILVGHLPLLLHQAPSDVLVIGLGTGITLRGLGDHPTQAIDCVEIAPEVVEASAWFEKDNGYALRNPKVRLIVDDGRNLLLTSLKRYDVIVSEPSNPWQTGNANLFTAEFYRLAASRLKPGGLFCQWLGLYDITPENLKIACNTFLQTFPRVLAFRAGTDLILVGGQQELLFDYRRMQQRLAAPGVRNALGEIGIGSPGELVALHYLYSEQPLQSIARGSRLNTDDRPVLEYSAKHNLGERTLGEFQTQNMNLLTDIETQVLLPLVNLGQNQHEVALALRDLGRGFAKAGQRAEAELFMRKAAEIERNGGGMPAAQTPSVGG
jgi:spermidine synthase